MYRQLIFAFIVTAGLISCRGPNSSRLGGDPTVGASDGILAPAVAPGTPYNTTTIRGGGQPSASPDTGSTSDAKPTTTPTAGAATPSNRVSPGTLVSPAV